MYAFLPRPAFVLGLFACILLGCFAPVRLAWSQCANLGVNLVINGDFQAGNQGFFTDYTLVRPGGCGQRSTGLCPEFTYVVAADPNLYHQNFWCPCTTATAANTSGCNCQPSERVCNPLDLKMFVNGRTQQAIVWRQTLNNLSVGTFYEFQAEVDNLIEGSQNLLDPYLRVTVDGVALDADIALPECPDAPQIMRCYFQAQNQTAVVALINLSTGAVGNDFSVDNIGVRGCGLVGTGVLFGCNLQVVLPVELLSFTAQAQGTDVQLDWRTATEHNNAGWALERSQVLDGPYTERVFVPGYGTTMGEQSYRFVDHNLPPGTYYYRLRQIDFDGRQTLGPVVEATVSLDKNISCFATQSQLVVNNGLADDLPLFVSTLEGVVVYTASAFGHQRTQVALAPGLYVVQLGPHAQKVLVP